MKLKVMLITVFAVGLGASFALASDGHGQTGDDHGKSTSDRCTQVHLHGTVAPQSLTVTIDKASKTLNLAAGSSVPLQLGAAGQTLRVEVQACSVTVGSATQLQVRSLELKAKPPKATSTVATTTTTP